MDNANFAHLHVHNEYSILDGYGTAKQYAKKAAAMGFKYLALTNHGNIDGCLKFQKACLAEDIQPILGAELYIVPDATDKSKTEKKGHIVILVKNQKGWEQLCALITKSHLEGFYSRPRTDYESILNCDLSGWIIMTACVMSFLNQNSQVFLSELHDRMKHDLYYEVMPPDHPLQIEFHERWKNLPLEWVATNDCHYIEEADVSVQDALLAIQTNKTWNDPKRWSFDFRNLYLRSSNEMVTGFKKQGQLSQPQIDKAMRNTIKIARQCSKFRLKTVPVSLPNPPKSKKKNVTIAARKKLKELGLWDNKEYQNRIQEEMRIITKKGFENYYLIVKDLVEWCKVNDIMVGDRGSVGGSLVAYLLGITQIDSIKHKLSFSRFISEDRIDLPDIDLDFEKNKRHLVIDYLKKTYGTNHTAGVSTYGKLQARGAIRDIGRIFEIPEKIIGPFAKSIDYRSSETLQTSLQTNLGRALKKNYSRETELALRLDGQIRNTGQHAAAIVLSSEDLRNGNRCTLRKSKTNHHLINWDMKDCEFFGLVKLDILGLSTLSVLNYSRQLIGNGFDFDVVEFEDPRIFKIITEGKTAGIFQLQARPTTELCKDLKIESFEDIVAAIALVRPGPTDSGMTADFIDRRHGKQWIPSHPIYEDVTADTYGLLVYQEQVMHVISRVGGLSESTADEIRKVIGKKRDVKEFEPYRKQFVEGCEKQKTFSTSEANNFWAGLLKWASYGFNRAHSVEYAINAYRTAWLKIYYPIQFYCAHMTYGEFDQDKPDKSKQRIIDEMLSHGYKIMPPKIDKSEPCRWVAEDSTFYMPFTELKGIGETGAKSCCKIDEKKIITRPGFWDIQPTDQNLSASEELMKEIEAYDPESIPEGINKHLEFNMNGGNAENIYPNLVHLLGYNTNVASIESIGRLEGGKYQIFPPGLIQRRRFHINEVVECEKCDLTSECKSPIVTSTGQYNVFIIGDPSTENEDNVRQPFVGREAGVLWDEINRYGYSRRFFHVSNTCRCFPKITKTPKKDHIDVCKNWVFDEIEETDCRLVLACGNIAQYALTTRDSGIQALSGTTEWIEHLGVWVCWCLHPSSVLKNVGNRPCFEKGIKNFIQKLELLL